MAVFFAFNVYLLTVITGATHTSSFSLHPEERFVWGVATAAYQIEGAVTDGGRGQTIWDSFAALPGKTDKGDTGEIADGSYYRIREDVQLIKDMGLSSYRFSIAWSRIMPTGEMPVNQAGIDHYNLLLDELESQGIEPLVTLYHWDLPSALEEKYEGWLSPDIENQFALYADVCFAAFGDRVKMWTTINEPWTFCLMGYVTGAFAPGRCSDRSKCAVGDSSTEGYVAAHNVLNAHAAAVQLYRDKYQTLHGGKIGMVLNQDWAEPLTNDPLDIIAAARKNEFTMAWFADPMVFGRYPDSMVELVGDRLPEFTPEQRDRLIGSYDYFAFNHYSTKYYYDPVRPVKLGEVRITPKGSIEHNDNNKNNNNNVEVERKDRLLFDTTGGTGWAADQLNSESKYDQYGSLIGVQAASAWLHVVPWGFYNVIMWNHNRYMVNNIRPIIYITENGCDVPFENDMTIAVALEDDFRVDYYRSYLEQMERAMADGADIRGFYAWSLLDNYEWIDGFANRFGLTYIDYKNATLPRYPKKSSKYYAEYARTHYSYDSSDSVDIDDDNMDDNHDDDNQSSGAVNTHTSNNSSRSNNEGASRHKRNKNKNKNKKNKKEGKGKDKGKEKGKEKGKGSSHSNDDTGPIIPVDDDYTLDPKNEFYKGGVSAPLRDQAKRMVAVSSVGGFMDFLNAAIGSNHGAAVFGPQGLVPC